MVKRRDAGSPAGNGGAWKHSPVVGVVLGVVIVACIGYIIYYFFGSAGSDSILPDNFPHSYLAVADNGNYDALLIKRGRRDTSTPFTENGKEYWGAYICRNPSCPGLKNNRPFIFAGVRVQVETPASGANAAPRGHDAMAAPMFCPKCKEMMDKDKDKNKNAGRAQYDITAVERYNTPEGVEILNKIREEYRKKNRG